MYVAISSPLNLRPRPATHPSCFCNRSIGPAAHCASAPGHIQAPLWLLNTHPYCWVCPGTEARCINRPQPFPTPPFRRKAGEAHPWYLCGRLREPHPKQSASRPIYPLPYGAIRRRTRVCRQQQRNRHFTRQRQQRPWARVSLQWPRQRCGLTSGGALELQASYSRCGRSSCCGQRRLKAQQTSTEARRCCVVGYRPPIWLGLCTPFFHSQHACRAR